MNEPLVILQSYIVTMLTLDKALSKVESQTTSFALVLLEA